MATNNSAISFQGLSSGISTDALVNAILAQEGQGVAKMTAKQTLNKARTTALTALKTSINSLTISLAALQDKFNSRTVTSTDANNTNVTASASGAAAGSYDLKVTTIATKGRISPTLSYTGSSSAPAVLMFTTASAKTTTGTVGFNITQADSNGTAGTFTVNGTDYALTGSGGVLTGAAGTPLEGLRVAVTGIGSGTLNLSAVPSNLSVSDPAAAIFSGSSARFAVQGTDGVVKAFDVTNNSLNGLRDAINASGAGVSASIVNTGAGANPYQLVISAKETGTGKGTLVTLAEVTSGAPANTLGITAGAVTVDGNGVPTTLTGGLSSSVSGINAQDAVFTLNGIQLTRQTNVVTDAAEGITFTLKQGGQTGTTSLTVAQDKSSALAGMQDLIAKFNALVKSYKDASTSVKNEDGSINQAPLANDPTTRALIAKIRSTLVGGSTGISGGNSTIASLGVQTLGDGTLSLNTVTFQTALEKDPNAAKRLFTFSGDSSNGSLVFNSGSAKTSTGTVNFVITEPTPGNFAGTFDGVAAVAGPNGTLVGTGAYEGLAVTVTAAGSGTLTLSRGAGQAVKDLLASATTSGTGTLALSLASIETQNKNLTTQINAGQSMLDRRKKVLQAQFAKMEVIVAQMRASAGSLSGA